MLEQSPVANVQERRKVLKLYDSVLGLLARYPRQFWVLLGGELVSIVGRSMVFPFLTLYLHSVLGFPLTAIGGLLAIFAVMGAAGQGVGGMLADRLGRKWVMAAALLASAVGTLALAFVRSLPAIGVLMGAFGFLGSFYDPASTAMVADLTREEDRAEAYSLWRVAANIGFAIGPAIGGLLAARSFLYAFAASTVGTVFFLLVVALAMHETYHAAARAEAAAAGGGYRDILRDRPFVAFFVLFTLAYTVYSLVFLVMPVYMEDVYGLGVQYFGLLMSINALIVVTLQFPLIHLLRGINHLVVVAMGVLLAAAAVAGVALASTFAQFALIMVVLTVGENLFVPSSTTVVADLSPAELRGRYMGAYGLAWVIGWGLAPYTAGVLASWLGVRGPWLVGGVAGVLCAAGLVALSRAAPARLGSGETEGDGKE